MAVKRPKPAKPIEPPRSHGGRREGSGRKKTEIDPARLEGLASIQCTIEEAAAALRIPRNTLRDRIAGDDELREIWDRGQDGGKVSLRRLLWRLARGEGSEKDPVPRAVQLNAIVHLSKFTLGMSEAKARGPNGDGAPDDPREVAKKIKAALDEIEQSVEGPPATTEKKGTS